MNVELLEAKKDTTLEAKKDTIEVIFEFCVPDQINPDDLSELNPFASVHEDHPISNGNLSPSFKNKRLRLGVNKSELGEINEIPEWIIKINNKIADVLALKIDTTEEDESERWKYNITVRRDTDIFDPYNESSNSSEKNTSGIKVVQVGETTLLFIQEKSLQKLTEVTRYVMEGVLGFLAD